MQRTLISTTIHLAKIMLAQVTNKQNGNPKEKEKEKERLEKKGWADYALSDTAPVFLSSLPFLLWLSFHFSAIQNPTKQKFASSSCNNAYKSSSHPPFTLKSCKLLLPSKFPTVASPVIWLVWIDWATVFMYRKTEIVSNCHYLRTLIGRQLPPISTCSRHIK